MRIAIVVFDIAMANDGNPAVEDVIAGAAGMEPTLIFLTNVTSLADRSYWYNLHLPKEDEPPSPSPPPLSLGKKINAYN